MSLGSSLSWRTSLVRTVGASSRRWIPAEIATGGPSAGLKAGALIVGPNLKGTRVSRDADEALLKVLAEMLDQVALGGRRMLRNQSCSLRKS